MQKVFTSILAEIPKLTFLCFIQGFIPAPLSFVFRAFCVISGEIWKCNASAQGKAMGEGGEGWNVPFGGPGLGHCPCCLSSHLLQTN